MDCSTCINRHNPYKGGYCRTMTEKPKDPTCHMTKDMAMEIEKLILAQNTGHIAQEARKYISFLERLEN